MERYIEGDNYHIEIEGPLAVYRVFRRPDLDDAAGARSAVEGTNHLRSLVMSGRVSGVAFDMSGAPPVLGPRTEASLEELAYTCKRNRCAFLFIAPPMVTRIQLERIFRRSAHPNAAIVEDLAEAIARTPAVGDGPVSAPISMPPSSRHGMPPSSRHGMPPSSKQGLPPSSKWRR